MNRLFWMTGIAVYLVAILMISPVSNVARGQGTCSVSIQASDNTGQHGASLGVSAQPTGSCSESASARAGQTTNRSPGACHFAGTDAFSRPPPQSPANTATCTSSSAGPSGLSSSFRDGSPQAGSCTQGVNSP
jgi:hypothetical protein